MIAAAYLSLNTTQRQKAEKPKPHTQHLKHLRKWLSITWDAMAEELNNPNVKEPKGKRITKTRMTEWAAGRVSIRPWLVDGIVKTYAGRGVPETWFSMSYKSITKNYPVAETNDTEDSFKDSQDEQKGGDSALSLHFMSDDASLHKSLASDSAHRIPVPDWLDKPGFYAVKIDTDRYRPLFSRGDVLVLRSNDVFKERKLSLISVKATGESALATTRYKGDKTVVEIIGGDTFDIALVHHDGLVVAVLPDYAEGNVRATLDFTGIVGPEKSE